jgi:hypothetical protein
MEQQIEMEVTRQTTLADMDNAIRLMKEAQEEYRASDKIAKEAYAKFQHLEATVIKMMEENGKELYIAEGVARVKISHIMSVQTPKTVDEKKAFFNWLKQNCGEDVHDAYMTVNSQSLNSLYNDLTEQYAARGEILMIEGLGEPTSRTKLSITKA